MDNLKTHLIHPTINICATAPLRLIKGIKTQVAYARDRCKFTDEKQDLWGRMWGRIFINTSTILILNVKFRINGGPRRIRTPDPLIRSQVLYPAELSVHSKRD